MDYENMYKKAYDWALTHTFEEIEIDYAARLALKMLDDSCNMTHEDRRVFFNVYDALTDRADVKLEDDVNQLIQLARNRQTIFSKPEFAHIVHACKMEVMPTTEKRDMKKFKKLVRKNLGLLEEE
ncbi:hypothetical protein [Sulfurimonas sp.]|uniref:hypothetical protein n=1 Tax=Sulfurimonas sp. TaxID=2022749 RepID=UPI00356831A3